MSCNAANLSYIFCTQRTAMNYQSCQVLECPSVLRLEAEAKERAAAVQRSQKT